MSQRNPNSVNARKLDPMAGSDRAARRAYILDRAQEASTGDAGQAEGDRAKSAVQTGKGTDAGEAIE